MGCIGIDNILSTTVFHEDFLGDSEVIKFSKASINKLKEIANKYKENNDTFNIHNKDTIYLINDNNSYSREFIYKFTNYISIEKLVYPLVSYDVISYEIIDLSDSNERLILYSEETYKDIEEIEIKLKNIRVNHIKLIIRSKKNIWPKVSEIQIIESTCKEV